MRDWIQFALAILFVVIGEILLGVIGLVLAGVGIGLMFSSSQRGFLISGAIAALFWIILAIIQTAGGQSQQLLALAASLAQLSGAKIWLLVLVSSIIAFLAGGLGGWLGGSLRQIIRRAT